MAAFYNPCVTSRVWEKKERPMSLEPLRISCLCDTKEKQFSCSQEADFLSQTWWCLFMHSKSFLQWHFKNSPMENLITRTHWDNCVVTRICGPVNDMVRMYSISHCWPSKALCIPSPVSNDLFGILSFILLIKCIKFQWNPNKIGDAQWRTQ